MFENALQAGVARRTLYNQFAWQGGDPVVLITAEAAEAT
jgi:hypothetical protein